MHWIFCSLTFSFPLLLWFISKLKILSRTPWHLIIAKNEFEIEMMNYKRRKHQTEKRTFCVSGKRRASFTSPTAGIVTLVTLFLFLNSHNPFTWHVNRYLVMALIIRAQSVNTCFASITILLFFGRVALFLERSSKTRHRIFNEQLTITCNITRRELIHILKIEFWRTFIHKIEITNWIKHDLFYTLTNCVEDIRW